jgi:hypothetical protein
MPKTTRQKTRTKLTHTNHVPPSTNHTTPTQVGTGVMVGLPGQTLCDLAADVAFFKSFGANMIGMVGLMGWGGGWGEGVGVISGGWK